MKLILTIYDHSVMMHVKFHVDVIGCGELLPFDCLNIHKNVFRYTGIMAI